jgi:hypothetical protein
MNLEAVAVGRLIGRPPRAAGPFSTGRTPRRFPTLEEVAQLVDLATLVPEHVV